MEDKNLCVVYGHKRLDNNTFFYIGVGNNIKRAYSKHSRNPYWKSIVKKCGYSVEILNYIGSYSEALKLEVYWIDYYGRKDLGKGELVNMTDGGEGTLGAIISKESRLKLSEASKGKSKPEFSLRHRENIAKAKKGVRMPEETKSKISIANKGKKKPIRSEEHSLNLSKSNKGTKKPRAWIQVTQFNLNGDYIATYLSLTEAQEVTGISYCKICEVCKGRRKTAGGFIWKYKNT